MGNKKYYVGLDIGTTKIVAMIGMKNEYGKIKILGVGHAKSLGILGGVVNNISHTIESIERAVSLAKEASGLDIKDVEVGIAGKHIRSSQHSCYIIRENSEEVISQADIEQLKNNISKLGIRDSNEEIIHILPQEFKVDNQSDIKDPIGMAGERLEGIFHVVIGKVNSIKDIWRCVNQAGLNLTGLTLEPLASADAVLSDEEKEAGVALVDIGGGTTDLAIFKDNIIQYTSVIPFGGNIITEDIKEGCTIIGKYAERLKVEYGSAWPGANKENELVSIAGLRGREPKEISLRNLSMIIHARMKEIIEHVFNEIRKYGYDEQKKKLIGGIVLTGGGSELKHIRQLVEYETGLDVRIGYPNEHLAGNSDKRMCSPIFATSVGLVMSAIRNDNQNTRKEPEVVEKPKEETPEIKEEVKEEHLVLSEKNTGKSKGIMNRLYLAIKGLIDDVGDDDNYPDNDYDYNENKK